MDYRYSYKIFVVNLFNWNVYVQKVSFCVEWPFCDILYKYLYYKQTRYKHVPFIKNIIAKLPNLQSKYILNLFSRS